MADNVRSLARSDRSPVLARTLVGLLLATTAGSAYAQDAAPAPVTEVPGPGSPTPGPALELQAAPDGGEITVTGSRIARNGYDQPTPVTVIGTAEIQASAPANLADFVNQIPSVVGSVAPSNSQRQLSNGTAGVNTINLRNLGSNRTLVLLDGRRSVGSVAEGTVDINTIPQGLVKNVEVVTGGAASVYGSDAVAGVVNFILDKTFKGLKGEVSYGETERGDDKTKRAILTGGAEFAGGRGHVIVSGQYIDRDGVKGAGDRAWAARGHHLTQNPAYVAGNGQPELLATDRSGLNTTTGGGIITSAGALRGIYFGQGGVVNRYNYGENRLGNSPWTVGGDWQVSQQYYKTDIQPEERVKGIFGRASYEFADWFELFGEVSYNTSRSINQGGYGTDKANVPIARDNAFLITALARAGLCTQTVANGVCAQVPAAGVTIGTWNADQPARTSDNDRRVQRYVIGGSGGFDLIGLGWKWNAYYQKGIAKAHETVLSAQRIKLGYSTDAVFNAAGQIVCRVTRDGSADPLAAGCQPYNRLGIYGSNDPVQAAGLNYYLGVPTRDERIQQDVAALNFNTSSIPNPFGKPIGLAFGAEHRREAITGVADPYSRENWVSGNFLPTIGSYTVNEGYVEALVPLPFKFEFNGAARYTSYSRSGDVQTWKAGLVWEPIPDIRFRATRSRDIRAPNLTELFQAGSRNTNSLGDPWNNRTVVRYTQSVGGNLDLSPEKADTLGLGLVFTPSFLRGFGLSVDYYDIKIKGAIGNVTSQQTVDRCFTGTLELCQRLQAVVRDPSGASQTIAFGSPGFTQAAGPGPNVTEYLVGIQPFNFLQQRSRGLDLEVSYRFPLSRFAGGLPGTVNLRGFATRYLENSESNGIDRPTDTVGQNTGSGPPKWNYRATLGYDLDRFSMQLTGRGLSAGVYNNQWIECQTTCPATGTIIRTIQNNHINGAFYLDAYFAYTIPVRGSDAQLYFRVANLLDKDPTRVGKGPSDNSNVDTGINQTLYDFLGRRFTVGLRFNLGG